MSHFICILLAFNIIGISFARAEKIDQSLEAQVLSGKVENSSKENQNETPQVEEKKAEDKVQEENLDDETKKIENSLLNGQDKIPKEHIFVVQRRYIHKTNAHEITPLWVGIQPADSFRVQISWGATYAYHFSDSFGIEVLGAHVINNYSTGLDDKIYKVAGVKVDRIEPVYSLGSSIMWTPFKAKSAALETVNYFEGYFSLGGGYTKFAQEGGPMASGGVGIRIYINRRSLLKGEFRDFFDFHGRTTQRPNLFLGMSVLFSDTLTELLKGDRGGFFQ